MDFTINADVFRELTIDGLTGRYISIPDAATIIQQKYPTYKRENLYAAALRIDRDGHIKLRTVLYQPDFGPARRLIPESEFLRWLGRDDLGSMSRPRRNGRYRR